jgi:hypothetical protein
MDAAKSENVLAAFLVRGFAQLGIPQQRLLVLLFVLILAVDVVGIKPNLRNLQPSVLSFILFKKP